jgi:hypothetical protein
MANILGSVECPFCAHPLPEPTPRFCPHCGREIAGAPPPELPAAEAPPPGGPEARGGPPWERPGAGFSELVDTTRQVLTEPTAFFAAMRVTGGLGRPLVYGLILGTIGLVATTLYRAVFWASMGPGLGMLRQHRAELPWLVPFMQTGFGLVLQLILGPPFLVIGLFVAAGIVHLLLLLFGGARRGFEATFRVLCYCEATALISLLPICGSLIQTVYMLVLAIIGLAEAHGVSRGTTAAAILVPVLILCCCCGFGSLLAIGGIASFLRRTM